MLQAAPGRLRSRPPVRRRADDEFATVTEEFERFFAEAYQALDAIQFFKTRYPEHIMRSLRALTFRATPDSRELSLLRAMALEVVRYLERTGRIERTLPADAAPRPPRHIVPRPDASPSDDTED